MKIERRGAEGPLVTGFSGGGFNVDGLVYRALLITPEWAEGWTPPLIGELAAEHLEAVMGIEPRPEFLLLGTGATLVRPPAALEAALGVGIEAMDSRAAARAWGMLRAEQRWIVGAFYPLG